MANSCSGRPLKIHTYGRCARVCVCVVNYSLARRSYIKQMRRFTELAPQRVNMTSSVEEWEAVFYSGGWNIRILYLRNIPTKKVWSTPYAGCAKATLNMWKSYKVHLRDSFCHSDHFHSSITLFWSFDHLTRSSSDDKFTLLSWSHSTYLAGFHSFLLVVEALVSKIISPLYDLIQCWVLKRPRLMKTLQIYDFTTADWLNPLMKTMVKSSQRKWVLFPCRAPQCNRLLNRLTPRCCYCGCGPGCTKLGRASQWTL